MGAAGLTSSSFEMAHRAGTGLELDLDKVPTRELGMSAYELLLSESQERMLMVCAPQNLSKLKEIYEKWDLHAEVIGKVIEEQKVLMKKGNEVVVDLPVDLVSDPPPTERSAMVPGDLKQRWFIDRNKLLLGSLESKFEKILEYFSFGNPGPLCEQYDSMVGNRTDGGVLDDAALIRLREITGRKLRLALSVDGNPRISWLSPREGGRRAVVEGVVNVALKGAEAIGITDCLNFGSPQNPEVMWQFAESVEGISEACEALNLPVVSGNVSFYNETDGKSIYPSPMIGTVGVSEGTYRVAHSHFHSSVLDLALIGPLEGGLGGSVLVSQWFQRECGQPEETDLKAVIRTLNLLNKIKTKRFDFAAHDISDGGLLLALLEMAFYSPLDCLGLELNIPRESEVDAFLFGETTPRLLIAFDSTESTEVEVLANQAGVKFTAIGQVNDQGKLLIKQGGAKALEREMKPIRQKWDQRWRGFF
jgi:phosphoribosylformylglycinamidine synthase